VGRVAFVANLATIRAEIAQGWPLATVYARHKQALGITYSGFLKLVRHYASDAKPLQRQPRTAPVEIATPLEAAPAGNSGSASYQDRTSDARHAPPRTFDYDGTPKQDDKIRLIGEHRPTRK
jgi:hypothetical protein